MKFRIIIRFTDTGLAARSTDFPQLTATGRTVEEVENNMCEVIEAHVKNYSIEQQRVEQQIEQQRVGQLF